MTAPQAILNPRKLLKESAGGHSFETVDEFADLLVGLDANYKVYVVNLVFSGKQFYALLFAKFFQYLGQSVAHFAVDNRAAIFDAPNDVDLQLMDGMTTRTKVVFHTKIYDNQREKMRKTPVKSDFSQSQPTSDCAALSRLSDTKFLPALKGGVSFGRER